MPPESTADLVARIHRQVIEERLDPEADRRQLVELVRKAAPLLGTSAAAEVVTQVVHRTVGLGPIETLLADPQVTEVLVNGAGPVWCERNGQLSVTDIVLSAAEVASLTERAVRPSGRHADRRSPMVDAALPDGSRLNVVLPPIGRDGPYLSIRRFRRAGVSLDSFAPAEVVDVLREVVDRRCNVVVIGATSAGKTTLLNALAARVSPTDRVITLEDAAGAFDHPHVVRLETRPPSADGVPEITMRDLVRNAMRMRPDRLVIGEVRGAETLDLLLALNTGHDGSLATCHANGPLDALRRLEVLALTADADLPLVALREWIHAAIDIVVEVRRDQRGCRRIASVAELDRDASETPRLRPLVEGGVVLGSLRRHRAAP